MSRDRIEFHIAASPEATAAACVSAAEAEGWSASMPAPNRVQIRQGMKFTTWPVKLDVNLASTGAGTSVRVDARVGGMGPIQKAGMQKVLNAFQSRVVWSVGSTVAAVPAGDPDADLRRLQTLTELRDAGALTEEEFAQQKARLLGSPG